MSTRDDLRVARRNRPRRALPVALLGLISALSAPFALGAQTDKPQGDKKSAPVGAGASAQGAGDAQAPVWPTLNAKDEARAKFLLRKLEAAGADEADEAAIEAGETATTDLIAMGPAIAPTLMRRLTDADRALHGPIGRVLDGVLTVEHAPLLHEVLDRKHVPLRRYVTLRLARFHDQGSAEVLRARLADKDADTAFYAALGLAGLGDVEALGAVFARCREAWREQALIVAEVLAPARDGAATQWVLDRMKDGDEQDEITGLRLLRSLCPKDRAGLLRGRLDSKSHAVKKEAVNALRAVIDGEAPLEDLSVFQAIEHANKWKARL